MNRDDMLLVDAPPEQLWTLIRDRKFVRFHVPPIAVKGAPRLDVMLDFDADSVDELIVRLSVLRAQMLPPLPAPSTRT
jgi:hypothetical protein